jgi:predicted nucleotidyltransferase
MEDRESDVDIAVFGTDIDYRLRRRLIDDLEKLLGKVVDVSVLNYQTDSLFAFQVQKYGVIIFSRDDQKRYEVETRYVLRYYDDAFYRKQMDDIVQQRLCS